MASFSRARVASTSSLTASASACASSIWLRFFCSSSATLAVSARSLSSSRSRLPSSVPSFLASAPDSSSCCWFSCSCSLSRRDSARKDSTSTCSAVVSSSSSASFSSAAARAAFSSASCLAVAARLSLRALTSFCNRSSSTAADCFAHESALAATAAAFSASASRAARARGEVGLSASGDATSLWACSSRFSASVLLARSASSSARSVSSSTACCVAGAAGDERRFLGVRRSVCARTACTSCRSAASFSLRSAANCSCSSASLARLAAISASSPWCGVAAPGLLRMLSTPRASAGRGVAGACSVPSSCLGFSAWPPPSSSTLKLTLRRAGGMSPRWRGPWCSVCLHPHSGGVCL